MPIPQPYPNYINVQHKIEVPVFKVVPEIIEKRVPYTVEKPYKVEVEKPYPIEVYKKIEIPVPMPYPVHVVYYKHVSEEDQATNQNKLSNNGYAKSPSVSYSHQQTQNTPLYSNSPSNAYGIQSQSHGVQSHGVQSHGVQSQQYKRDVPSYSNQASYPNRRPMNSNREYSNRNERQPKFYNSEYAGEITPNHERDHHQQRNDKYLYSGY